MTTSSPMECGVCHEEYDEESRCPRILSCFHHLCSDCLEQLIANDTKKCPFCRKAFEARSARDVRVNQVVLDFMKYMASGVTSQMKRISEFQRPSLETSSDLLIGCQDTRTSLQGLIQKTVLLRENIAQNKAIIADDILPKLTAITDANGEADSIIEGESRKLHLQLTEVEEVEVQLTDLREKLNTASTVKEAASVVIRAEETNNTTLEWSERCREAIADSEVTLQETLEKVRKTREKVDILREVLNHRGRENSEVAPLPSSLDAIAIRELLTGQLSSESLLGMSEPVKQAVIQGRVCALQGRGNDRRFANISMDENKLFLHYLVDGSPPGNAIAMQHAAVLGLVDSSSRLAFLEFGDGELALGRLYVRLAPDTQRAKQFAMLCTGETGFSYLNSRLLGVWEKGKMGEYVGGGDYEKNNGYGGKALVPGLELGLECRRPRTAGTVWAWWVQEDVEGAQFYIYTRDDPGKRCYPAFGMVEEGLDILRDAVNRYSDIKEVKVTDCGLVLASF